METLDHRYVQLDRVDGETKAEFIRKTYTHVAGAVLVFMILEAFLLSLPGVQNFAMKMVSSGGTWLLIMGGFMLLSSLAQNMANQTHNVQRQYLGLGLYILLYAVIFLPLIMFAQIKGAGPSIINQAGIVTLGLFGGLTAIVFTTGKDFSFLRSVIVMGGFIALGLIVAGVLFKFNLGLWFSVGMVALSGATILYQTSQIDKNYTSDQHVSAAMGIFGSLMLMFWYVLQIFMSRD
jgi:FtsH-binding integral membrane protein